MLRTAIAFALLLAPSSVWAATGYTHNEARQNRLNKRLGTSTNPQVTVQGSVCTVKPLGGGRDDAPALLYAMNELCTSSSLIELPGYYTVHTVLRTNLTNVEVRLGGAISYVPDIAYWNASSIYLTYQNATTYWFFEGHGATLHGGGTITANGQAWWEYFARSNNKGVAGGSSTTFARPIPLVIGNSTNVVVEDLSIIDSPFWHNFVYQSNDVKYQNIQIRSISNNASAPAANSDGWDIYRSSNVVIRNSNVQNGDDCVSFKPNSTFCTVENMICNGSHGISVGSLGQYAGQTDIVSDLYVRNITMLNAENGARIKVFGGSNDTKSVSGGGSGYVRNVTFQDFSNSNVDNPIYITQCYSSSAQQCEQFPATLQISDVHFINVTGTASGKVANSTVASLECSAVCQNITAVNTRLTPKNGTARYNCANLANEALLDFPCTDVPITKG
ncbi:glycoside hydrolase family 28 protein [Dioszegia hungarica]|uniref:galacturonan 1,4-alpha-galacturonidase n=1 Tax=Dioszegia hungarica TaxID=4972 RepID=A0AA38HAQ4_9TREE|nr:glycoside hydrolase family 28 protein [Dioszegia hungarica]KAI9636877.1 glycoside hydrolase family 28 protein [Dioszegia hungarica]